MDKSKNQLTPLDRAIKTAGGVSKLASLLEVAPNVVSNWKLRKRVPSECCKDVERVTAGAVTRYDLRPDVFGPAPSKQEAA